MSEMSFDKIKSVISSEKIAARVGEMGLALKEKFKNSGGEPVAICVLSGSFIFFSDLIRAIDLELQCEFLAVSSYGDKKVSSGEVKITLDVLSSLEGRDVILIEDLVDSGLTMNFLINMIKGRKPKSLTTVSLLLKPKALKVKCPLDLVGFEIPNDFIVGYGIDYAGNFRHLPYLGVHGAN